MKLRAWAFIIIGGLIYYAGKGLIGYPVDWRPFIDSVWWSGSALLFAWYLEFRELRNSV